MTIAMDNARSILDNHQEQEKKQLLIISILSAIITGHILDGIKLPFLTHKQTKYFCFGCHKKFQSKCKSCSGCDLPRYCSKECQLKDWPIHKHECKIIKNKMM
jgi:hypothetical protein